MAARLTAGLVAASLAACQTPAATSGRYDVVAASAAAPAAAAAELPRLDLTTAWLNLDLPDVRVIRGGAEDELYDYHSFEPLLIAAAPATSARFRDLDEYRGYSRAGFFAGLGGMAASLYYAHQHAPRTAGNAIWGVGWLIWLGFAAVVGDELHDLAAGFRLHPKQDGSP